jgi:hypothetical protein
MSRAAEPEVRIDGNYLVVNGVEVHLHFLETFKLNSDGSMEPRVRVYCQGCRRFKSVKRVGLRHMGGGVIELQSNCHECRAVMNARKRRTTR